MGVGAVIVHDGKVLIVQRGAEPRKGEWTVPGGVLELGETLRQAAEREVLEETGLKVKAEDVVEVVDSIYPDAQGKTMYHYVLIDFSCRVLGGELRAGSDVAQARWITPDELDQVPLIGRTAEIIGKALERS